MAHRKTELRRLRRALDLTLVQLQDATGIHQNVLSLIERGRLVPTDEQGQALVLYFGQPLDALLAPARVETLPNAQGGSHG